MSIMIFCVIACLVLNVQAGISSTTMVTPTMASLMTTATDPTVCDKTFCSGHGVCYVSPKTKQTVCDCDDDYMGRYCQMAKSTKAPTPAPTQAPTPSTHYCDPDQSNNCHNQGQCIASGEGYYFCDCFDKYYGQNCEIEKKSRETAICLSFFMGWMGADRLYLGYIFAGIVKLMVGLAGFASLVILLWACCGDSPNADGQFLCLFGCLAFIGFIWWIVDFSMITSGALGELDGTPLYMT